MKYDWKEKLSNLFQEAIIENEKIIKIEFKDISLLWKNIDLQYQIASYYFIFLPLIRTQYPNIQWACFHNNLINLMGALNLATQGLYGSANIILRNIFEGLIISKFCSLSQKTEIYDRWVEGRIVGFSNFVLDKIKAPATCSFKELWRCLCKFTHTTTSSGQPYLSLINVFKECENPPKTFFDTFLEGEKKNIKKDFTAYNEFIGGIAGIFVLVQLFLECNYHLLLSHAITSSLKYSRNLYLSDTLNIEKQLKEELKSQFKIFKSKQAGMLRLSKESKMIIKNYKSKWIIV